jgi:type I restriction enzyme, R subunit
MNPSATQTHEDRIDRKFSSKDRERLAFLQRYRSPLRDLGPDPKIVDRAYQRQAIKRVTEAIEQGHRHFLLVMATGTGKTRTVIALIDPLIRARWIQRVLFLVDRRELARQALGDFKEYLSHESRTRIEGRQINDKARIHVATYPSMMQVYKQLSPGYYDLIVADESHRSIYNHYKKLLDYFVGMQLGTTATPTDYIDHNTFELFKCPDGFPTFYYSYEAAVEEGYLSALSRVGR